MSDLYIGRNFILGENVITWNGNTSFTWENITFFLFNKTHDFDKDFNFLHTSPSMTVQKIRIMPFFECLLISNFAETFYIGTTSAINVQLVDPYRYTSHRFIKEAFNGDEIFQE
jgi:hypothetical protein